MGTISIWDFEPVAKSLAHDICHGLIGLMVYIKVQKHLCGLDRSMSHVFDGFSSSWLITSKSMIP